ncbi:DUF72 domain-containing protein [Halalkalibacter nanhaiisediminis]|uniref:Uncharacterized protein YecE (DUF72 family) n=1 Tax=Halalkalibacter nanhaiisediminis TaxID=688079 RepID=A0A562QTL5_9BACI|nr:DUF72 domain-containing protein [Halalkalibacter nanhaiisediminis]TWI60085.1 uncharacterized protein YecE (DUF72 family) [Halalkalibacter nanhaiisediminis]
MIYIGLAGWGDHDTLYEGVGRQSKLAEYAGHFPIVELDSSFYAVQPIRNMEKWARETPVSFRFVVKAYQAMTGHQRGYAPFETKEEMFDAFRASLKPLIQTRKLAMVLCQFPPWFECKKESVQWLRYVKQQLQGLPVVLEFRHQSWFTQEMRPKTLQFMKDEDWIHSICDEPQAGSGSIPTVLEATDTGKTLIRLHGRNVHGWRDPGDGTWRDVRYLYRYNHAELTEWKENIEKLTSQSKDIYVIFNNNSGGDAADNAKQFINMLGIEYVDLAPRQLNLFSE